uniref:BHLH domain-containing protein n=1 Tax=Steinernema glaseri TaxID=37863 RepID=A0A1I8A0Z5_9BILA
MTPSVKFAHMSHKALDSGRKRKLSEGDDFSDSDSVSSPKSLSPSLDDDRRQHHNDLERKRREHIKGAFAQLKAALPMNDGEKPSRAAILRKAYDELQRFKSVDEDNRRLKEEMLRLQKENDLLRAQSGVSAYSSSGLIGIKTQEPQLPTSLAVGVPSTSSVNPLSYPVMTMSGVSDTLSVDARNVYEPSFKTQPLVSSSQLDLLNMLNMAQQQNFQQKLQQLQLQQIQHPTPLKPASFDLQAHLLAAGLRGQ